MKIYNLQWMEVADGYVAFYKGIYVYKLTECKGKNNERLYVVDFHDHKLYWDNMYEKFSLGDAKNKAQEHYNHLMNQIDYLPKYISMKCKKCEEQGLLSWVENMGTISTLLEYNPYYDESDIYHIHNPNKFGTSYKCNNGHTWTINSFKKCPNCDYGKD